MFLVKTRGSCSPDTQTWWIDEDTAECQAHLEQTLLIDQNVQKAGTPLNKELGFKCPREVGAEHCFIYYKHETERKILKQS